MNFFMSKEAKEETEYLKMVRKSIYESISSGELDSEYLQDALQQIDDLDLRIKRCEEGTILGKAKAGLRKVFDTLLDPKVAGAIIAGGITMKIANDDRAFGRELMQAENDGYIVPSRKFSFKDAIRHKEVR